MIFGEEKDDEGDRVNRVVHDLVAGSARMGDEEK